MNQSIIDSIFDLEERLRQAMSTSNIKELDTLLSDNLLFTTHLGAVITKRDDIDMHSSGNLEIEEIRLSEQSILPYEEIAIVTTKADILGSYKGSPANGTFRFTRVWRKSSETHWQVIAGHACAMN